MACEERCDARWRCKVLDKRCSAVNSFERTLRAVGDVSLPSAQSAATMLLTTSQIARVIGCNNVNAWKATQRWQARGVVVESVATGARPTRAVAVDDVARMLGLRVEDVCELAGVRR